jgi:hypothetical protein
MTGYIYALLKFASLALLALMELRWKLCGLSVIAEVFVWFGDLTEWQTPLLGLNKPINDSIFRIMHDRQLCYLGNGLFQRGIIY